MKPTTKAGSKPAIPEALDADGCSCLSKFVTGLLHGITALTLIFVKHHRHPGAIDVSAIQCAMIRALFGSQSPGEPSKAATPRRSLAGVQWRHNSPSLTRQRARRLARRCRDDLSRRTGASQLAVRHIRSVRISSPLWLRCVRGRRWWLPDCKSRRKVA